MIFNTLKVAFSKWPILSIFFGFASLLSVNIAGLLRQLPTPIRQLLDPSFFANHVASLGISLAYSILAWRISFVVISFLFSVYPVISPLRFFRKNSEIKKAKYYEAICDYLSSFSGLLIALLVFSYSHFGVHGFASLAQFLVLLTGSILLYAIWQFITKDKNYLSFSKAESASTRIKAISDALGSKMIRNMIRIFILGALLLSYYTGELRMVYLITQESAQVYVGQEGRNYKIVGSTASGVIVSQFAGVFSSSHAEDISFSFITYDALVSVQSDKLSCYLGNKYCISIMVGNVVNMIFGKSGN